MIRIISLFLLVLLFSVDALAEGDHLFTPIPMGPGGSRLPQPGGRAETNELPGLEGNPSKFLQLTKGRVTAENLSKGLQDLRDAKGDDFKRESDEFAGMIGNTPNGLNLLRNGGANINPQNLLNAFCLGQLNPNDLQTLADSFKRIGEPKGESKSGEDGTSAPRVSATRDREPSSNDKSGVSPPRPSSTKHAEKSGAKGEVSEDPVSPPRKSAVGGSSRSSGDEVSPPRVPPNVDGTSEDGGVGNGESTGTDKQAGGGSGPGDPNNLFDPNDCPQNPNVFDQDPGNNGNALDNGLNKNPPGQGGPGNGGDPSGGGGGGGFPPIGGGQIPGSPERDQPKAPPAAQIAPMPKLSLAPPVPEGGNLLGLIAAAGAVQFQFTGLGDAVQRMTAEFIARINASATSVFPNGIPPQTMQPAQAASPATNIRSLLQNSTSKKRTSTRGISR